MYRDANYYVQLQAKRHELLMPEQELNFKIDPSFLEGLSESEFYTAYSQVFMLIKGFYQAAKENPEELGLPLYPLETYRTLGKEARESEFSLLWFPIVLFALGTAGTVLEDRFFVDSNIFAETLKTHKHKKLAVQFNYLVKQGFQIPEWNSKSLDAKIPQFCLEYAKNPKVFTVLKAAASRIARLEKQGAKLQVFDFHRFTQFPHFLPELFSEADADLPSYTQNYFLAALEKESDKLFYTELMDFFRQQGLEIRYNDDLSKNRLYDKKGKDTLNHLEYTDYRYGKLGESKLLLRLKLNKPSDYIGYIEKLPPEIKESFQNVSCGHCTELCNRRISYTLDTVHKESCGCFSFLFWNTDTKYLPYYKALYLQELEARNKL